MHLSLATAVLRFLRWEENSSTQIHWMKMQVGPIPQDSTDTREVEYTVHSGDYTRNVILEKNNN